MSNPSENPIMNWLKMSVAKLLEYQAFNLPDLIAIETQNSTITYEELNRRSNGLSQMIQDHSEPGEYVVVCTTDFIENIVSQFAALKAGKTVVLLDPHLSVEMLSSILESIPCNLILTSSNEQTRVEQLRVVFKEELRVVYSSKSGSKSTGSDASQSMENAAFIMFTSGSTGNPKGVIKSHQFIMHDLVIRAEKYQMTAKDRVMLTNDLFFGRTLFTALSTIFGGATMVVKDLGKEGIDVLPKWLTEHRITIFSPTGSMLRGLDAILSGSEFFSSLRILRIGADAVNGRDLEAIKRCITDDCLIWVNYGSTETGSICCDVFKKDRSITEEKLPVGKPYAGKLVRIVDKDGNKLPQGVSGHVLVISKYLTSGYLNPDDAVRDKYTFDTEADGTIQTTYHTGDIGQLNSIGMLELEGRADQVIKIRGYRVDLSYIEMQMNQLVDVAEAAVVVQDSSLTKRLMAYVVLRNHIDTNELKRQLSQRLPAYMIPSRIEILEALPRLSNGKIDKRLLSVLGSSKNLEGQPHLEVQEDIALFIKGLWVEALNHDDFSDVDSFFDIGGDSIGAAVMMADVEKHYQLELSSEVFWQDPTIKGLTDTIRLKSLKPDVRVENPRIFDDNKQSKQKYTLLHELVEGLKLPDGRIKLLRQRKIQSRLIFLWGKFRQEYQRGRGLSFITDWCHVKCVKCLLSFLTYPQSVKFLSKLIAIGLVAWLIPKRRRKQIRTFNQEIIPHLTRFQLHKSYLFYILQEYQIINRARTALKDRKLKQMTVTVEGEEILKRGVEKGRGVLLVGSHTCGNLWLKYMDLDVLTIGAIDGIVYSYGLEKYQSFIYASLLNKAVKRLNGGEIVKIVADGDHGSSMKYPYQIAGFHKELFTGFAEIALQTNATVIPLTSYMTDPFDVILRFGQPMKYPKKSLEHTEKVKYLLSQYAEILQDQVVNFPWQVKIKHIMSEDFITDIQTRIE